MGEIKRDDYEKVIKPQLNFHKNLVISLLKEIKMRVLKFETADRIYINETQYFDNIPLVAWEFYIGGYQPAQKWLKDRTAKKGKEGRTLTYDDILHYQKIIVALTETNRIMREIDKINIE